MHFLKLYETVHADVNQSQVFPYAALEVRANLILKKIGPRIWLALIMVVWGISTTCIGTVENYEGLLVGRIFLGVAESGHFPGVMYLLSAFYGPQDLGLVDAC